MNRRVLTWATDQADAIRRLPGWKNEPDPKAELVGERWAVTAAKKTQAPSLGSR